MHVWALQAALLRGPAAGIGSHPRPWQSLGLESAAALTRFTRRLLCSDTFERPRRRASAVIVSVQYAKRDSSRVIGTVQHRFKQHQCYATLGASAARVASCIETGMTEISTSVAAASRYVDANHLPVPQDQRDGGSPVLCSFRACSSCQYCSATLHIVHCTPRYCGGHCMQQYSAARRGNWHLPAHC